MPPNKAEVAENQRLVRALIDRTTAPSGVHRAGQRGPFALHFGSMSWRQISLHALPSTRRQTVHCVLFPLWNLRRPCQHIPG